MTSRLNLLHKVVGILTVIAFIGTGQLLGRHYRILYEENLVVRMMFRSNHIYILLAGLINICIGTYLTLSDRKWRRAIQFFGSICLLIAPPILMYTFFSETRVENLERPFTLFAIVLLFVGTLSHLFSSSRTQARE